MRAIALGVHVLDVLVRPVEEIPEGQGGTLVEEIRITAAGTAGAVERWPCQTTRRRRLSSITRAPCRKVMGVPGQRSHAAR